MGRRRARVSDGPERRGFHRHGREMRVLFLTHRLPYAPDRGDRIRAYHILRVLAGAADVDLVSLVHDEAEADHTDDLRGICGSVTLARISALRRYPAAMQALLT